MAASSISQTTTDRRYLHRETMRILNANSPHFIILSLLFLPLSFSASAALRSLSSSFHFDPATSFDPFTLRLIKTLISSSRTLLATQSLFAILAFTLLVIFSPVAGIAMITYSANQAIHHKPLTLSSAMKSLSHSYIPLLSTFIAGFTKLTLISLLFLLSAFAITEAVKALGFHFDEFIVSIFVDIIATDVLALTILFLMVIWGSAAAIAVLESKLGFEPLRQSAYRLTEFRSHSFSIVFLSGFAIGILMQANSNVVQKVGSGINWILVLQVSGICLDSSLTISHYVVANTVLYVQCKAAGGEGGIEMAAEGEVSGEYVTAAINDKKEKVGGTEANGGFVYMMYFCLIFWSFVPLVNVMWALW